MTILVTGATGNVGAAVVRALLARGERVTALVRDPARARRVLGPGMALAAADAGSVTRADALFLACGNVPEQVDWECSMIDAAARAGVGRVVKLSGPAAHVDSPLIFERWHGVIERHLAGSGVPAVLLRPRTFMTNLLAYARTIARTGMLFAPAADARISFVDPRDVAEAAAVALTEPGHEGATYPVTGPAALTFGEVAAALAAATGHPVSYVPVSDDQARDAMLAEGLPPMVADAIVAIFAAQRAGGMADTTGAVRLLTGREPRSVADFARDHASAFRPAPVASPAAPA